jgi:hypothetical protein
MNPETTKYDWLADSLTARVELGIKYLNIRRPGWYNNVVLSSLDMGDTYDCVLGQLFGEFWTFLASVAWKERHAAELGFSVTYDELTELYRGNWSVFGILTDIWRNKIEELQDN